MMSSRGRGLRVRKLERPRPLKVGSSGDREGKISQESSPNVSERNGKVSPEVPEEMMSIMTQLDNVTREIAVNGTPYREIRTVTDTLKDSGPSLECLMKEQLDSYFSTFRSIARQPGTKPLVVAYLLQLIELRAAGWSVDHDTYKYYQKKLGDLALRQDPGRGSRVPGRSAVKRREQSGSKPPSRNRTASCEQPDMAFSAGASMKTEQQLNETWPALGRTADTSLIKEEGCTDHSSQNRGVENKAAENGPVNDLPKFLPTLPSHSNFESQAANAPIELKNTLFPSYASVPCPKDKIDAGICLLANAGKASCPLPSTQSSRVDNQRGDDDNNIGDEDYYASCVGKQGDNNPWSNALDDTTEEDNPWYVKDEPVIGKPQYVHTDITTSDLSMDSGFNRHGGSSHVEAFHVEGRDEAASRHVDPLRIRIDNELFRQRDIDECSNTSSECDTASVASSSSMVQMFDGIWRKRLRMDDSKHAASTTKKRKSTIFSVSVEDAQVLTIPKVIGFIAAASDTSITKLEVNDDDTIVLFEICGSSHNRNKAIRLIAERCSESLIKNPILKKSTTKVSPRKHRTSGEKRNSHLSGEQGEDVFKKPRGPVRSLCTPRDPLEPIGNLRMKRQVTIPFPSVESCGDLDRHIEPYKLKSRPSCIQQKEEMIHGKFKYQYQLHVKPKNITRLLGPIGERLDVIGQLTDTTITLQEKRGSEDWPVLISGKTNSAVRRAVEVIDDVVNKNIDPEKYVCGSKSYNECQTGNNELVTFMGNRNEERDAVSPYSEPEPLVVVGNVTERVVDNVKERPVENVVLAVEPVGIRDNKVVKVRYADRANEDNIADVCFEPSELQRPLPNVTSTFATSVLQDESIVYHYKVQVGDDTLVLTCPSRPLIKESKEVLTSYFLSYERTLSTTLDPSKGLNTSFIEEPSLEDTSKMTSYDTLSRTVVTENGMTSSTPQGPAARCPSSHAPTQKPPIQDLSSIGDGKSKEWSTLSGNIQARAGPLVEYEILDNSQEDEETVPIMEKKMPACEEVDGTVDLSGQLNSLSLADSKNLPAIDGFSPVKTVGKSIDSTKKMKLPCEVAVTITRFPIQPHYSEKHIASIESTQPTGHGSSANRRHMFAARRHSGPPRNRFPSGSQTTAEAVSCLSNKYRRDEILNLAKSPLAREPPADWPFLTEVLPEVCLSKGVNKFFDPDLFSRAMEPADDCFQNPPYRHYRPRESRVNSGLCNWTRSGPDVRDQGIFKKPTLRNHMPQKLSSRTKSLTDISDIASSSQVCNALHAHPMIGDGADVTEDRALISGEDAEVSELTYAGAMSLAESCEKSAKCKSTRPSSVPIQLMRNSRPM